MAEARGPTGKPATVDAYIAWWPTNVQKQLQVIRKAVHDVVPGIEEAISYGIPTFRMDGKYLIYASAAKAHTTIHAVGRQLMAENPGLFAGYKMGAGSVQFPHDKPIPVALVKKVVRLRVAMVKAKRAGYASGRKPGASSTKAAGRKKAATASKSRGKKR